MSSLKQKVPPPSRAAIRWFLFLTYYHLLPVPWYMAVVAGLAPASFLFAAGMTSLFLPDNDSLAFAAFLLAPALVAGLVFYLVAWLISLLIMKIHLPLLRTLALILLLAICLGVGMTPIFLTGGHGSPSSYSLFGFIDVLGEFRIPTSASLVYFSGLAVILLSLLGYQFWAVQREPVPVQTWLKRRRIRRRILVTCLLTLLLVFGWTQHVLLVVKPLADMGFASAQYRLAMYIKEQSGSSYGSGYHDWLVRAAEQGHLEAARQLVLHPRSKAEKLRWLTLAAEGGMADAQYEIYLVLLKPDPGVEVSGSARNWLEKAAENGQMDAEYTLGHHYLNGHAKLGIEKDLSKVRRWWERAADHGHGQAMIDMAWRYEKGVDGFTRDPQRAIELLNRVAEGYQSRLYGLSQNQRMADARRAHAEQIATLEARLAEGDSQAQAQLGRELLRASEASPETLSQGLSFLEKAAQQGDPQLQYELGGIFLFGRHGQQIDLPRGRNWWAQALTQNHVKTMEYVAPAYQSGRFGYPVDLLKSKSLVGRLVEAYRDGLYGVDPDPDKERYWSDELKYFDRLFELAGGSYQSPDALQQKADAGDVQAQYQLGRQMLVGGSAEQRQQGLVWIERAAEEGYAEAQYRLVTYFERQVGIMRTDPVRGVGFLKAASAQNHLPAMATLALGYYKGRYGLSRDYRQA